MANLVEDAIPAFRIHQTATNKVYLWTVIGFIAFSSTQKENPLVQTQVCEISLTLPFGHVAQFVVFVNL